MTEVLWRNAFGEPIDLDNIDREYALNIYTLAVGRRALRGYTRDEFMADPLIQKLRDTILEGRKPNARDRLRALRYNARCAANGLPYRARVR